MSSTSGESSEQGGSSSQTNDNQVNQTEWEAAFDLDKPYYMADNYNAVMRMDMEDETVYPSSYLALQVDSLKAKLTNKEVCTHEEEQFYVKVNNVYNATFMGKKAKTNGIYLKMFLILQEILLVFWNQ